MGQVVPFMKPIHDTGYRLAIRVDDINYFDITALRPFLTQHGVRY